MKLPLVACLALASLMVRLDAQIIFNRDPDAIPGMTSPLAPIMQPQQPGGSAFPMLPQLPTQPQQQPQQQPQTPAERIKILQQMGAQLMQAGRLQEAANAYGAAYQEIEKHIGPESLDAALAKMDIASVLRRGASYKEAMTWGEAAVGLLQKLGEKKKQTLTYALAVQKLGEMYMDTSEMPAAYKACQESSILLEKLLPEKDLRRITAAHDLGIAAGDMRYPEAEDLLRKALALREEVLGPDSIPAAYTAANLGRCLGKKYRFDEAEALILRSLAIFKAHNEQEAPMLLRCLGDLTNLYMAEGKIDKAETVLKEMRGLLRQTFGEDHQLGDGIYETESRIHFLRSQTDEAEQCILTLLERTKKHWGDRSLIYGGACAQVGAFYEMASREDKAERYYLTAYSVLDDSGGAESVAIGHALTRIGLFFARRREPNYLQAYDCLMRGTRILSKHGASHTTDVDVTLADVAHRLGHDEQAKKILEVTLGVFEADHNIISADYLKALAMLYNLTGSRKYEADAFKRVVTLVEEDLRPKAATKDKPANKDEEIAETYKQCAEMNAVAAMALGVGSPAEAAKWARRSLDFRRSRFPGKDYILEGALIALASAEQDLHHPDEARRYLRESLQGSKMGWEASLYAHTGTNRSTFAAHRRPYALTASLDMEPETALLLLQHKSLSLQLGLLDHRFYDFGRTEEGRPLWEKLANLRSEYQEHLRISHADLTESSITDQIRAAETALAQHVDADGTIWDNFALTLDQLDAAIPPGAAVVDYFDYPHRNPGGTYEHKYGIMVFRHGHKPTLLRCGDTRDKINEIASYFTVAMGSPGKKARDKDKALHFLCRSAYQALISPIEKELEGVQTLYICPSHPLQFLPFAVLMDDADRFLVDRFSIRYLNSERDLLRPIPPADADRDRQISVFASPTYHEKLTVLAARRPTTTEANQNRSTLEALGFPLIDALPGSEHELDFIQKRADTRAWKTQVFRDEQASEANLRTLKSPSVLHLATRAFFLPSRTILTYEKEQAQRRPNNRIAEQNKFVDTSFVATGLFLTRARDSLDFWGRDYMLPREDDGFVRASEIASLDLHGTRLVFLSGADPGELEPLCAGFPNLRAAFLHAGTESLILTAWPVKDAGAAAFVSDFYDRYFASGDTASSLEITQREWLHRVQDQDGLWEALRQAGGYMLTSLARETHP